MIGVIGQAIMNCSWVLLLPMLLCDGVSQKRAFRCHVCALLLCTLILLYAFWVADPSLLSVIQFGGQHLSRFYRLVAMWGGQSGSLLLLTNVMAFWGYAYASKVLPSSRPSYLKYYALIIGGILLIGVLTSSPFEPLGYRFGVGMNPLLQDLGMAIHPPILYLGYISSIVPFLIVLSDSELNDHNIQVIQSATVWGLVILTSGILLGSWWAYRVLGWGGYWGWDPVESISLLPWVSMLGLYHAVIAKDRRWIIHFSLLAFVLAVCSTVLVRSGVLASVHTFSSEPNVARVLLIYTISILILALKKAYTSIPKQVVWYPYNYHYALSLIVILILLSLIIIPPIISGLTSNNIVLSPEFIGQLFLPILIFMFVAMSVYQQSTYIDVIGGVLGLVLMMQWFSFSQAVVMSVLFYMLLSMRHSAFNLTHASFGLFIMAVILNGHMSTYEDIVISPGERIQQGGYSIQLLSVANLAGNHYIDKVATLMVNGQIYTPAIRYYPNTQMSVSKVDVRVNIFDEHYIALGAIIGKEDWSMRIHHQVLLRWLWALGLLVGCSMLRRKR